MIGEIIKKQRLALDMSRRELAEDICSEKYVYLIERNERTPSAYILNSFSDRLGLDLFDYYQYIHYENKTKVLEHRENIERYIQISDIEKLKEESIKASKLPDFQKEPLIYDIQVIDALCKGVMQGKREEVIIELTELLATEKLNIDYITLINAHGVLAIVYQMEGQWEESRRLIEVAYKMVENKTKFPRYNTTVITIHILIISLLYNMEEYEYLIKYGTKLKEFQEKHREYNRFYYVNFYLSFAYYEMKKPEKAFDHFMRGGYSAILFKNKVDVYFITQMPGFKDISENLEVDPGFIEQIYEIIKTNDN